jgi:hypothetical protein
MLKTEDLIIEVRNKEKDRIGQISIKDIRSLEIVLNHNNVGTWSLTISAEHPLVTTLRKKGSGIVVATDSGTIISGNMTSVNYEYSAEEPAGLLNILGTDDNQYLADALAYPDPAYNAENQTKDKDTRTGSAESVLKDFVKYNIGPSAITARKISNLTIETNLDRGPILTKSTRWKNLGLVCYEVASVAELGFKIAQVGDNIQFQVYEPVDRSEDIVWSIENNNLNKTDFEFNAPVVTHAIVGGEGKGVDRVMKIYSPTKAVAESNAWGRRIEVFVDSKESETTGELNQAGAEAIEGGLVTTNTEVSPADASRTYMTDWNLGDIVKVSVNEDIELTAIIDSVGILVNNEGLTIKASINKSNRSNALTSQVASLAATAEGSGYKRQSITFTTPSIAANETLKTNISLAAGFRIYSIGTNKAARLRLYSNAAGQTDDETRVVTGYPNDIGLLLDVVLPHNFGYDINLSPLVDGFTSTGSATVPITIDNYDSTGTINITITYIRTE